MQANPDNVWIQIERIRLVDFEFEARRGVPEKNAKIPKKSWEIISLSLQVTSFPVTSQSPQILIELC
jgi:hypothetical protein